MLKKSWFKIYNLQKTTHRTIHSLSLSTAEEVLLRFCLRWLRYSDRFEYECNAVERIRTLHQGLPILKLDRSSQI